MNCLPSKRNYKGKGIGFLRFQKCKPFLKWICLSFFVLLSACESSLILPSSLKGKDSSFFESRRLENTDRESVLQKSYSVYSTGNVCSKDFSCRRICSRIFALDFDREDCEKLPAQQVYQFEKLSDHILTENQASLEEINIFDLKVFLNLSPEPLYRYLRTLSPFFKKQFFTWLALDWRPAKVFHEEDWDFLFLNIFLNELTFSPINFLRKELLENRTFVDLAWLKHNDSALFWLDNYFEQVQCQGFGKETGHCVLGQYCLLSDSLDSEVQKGFMSFSKLGGRLKQSSEFPRSDLKAFCSGFCSSEKGQNYCE